MWSWGRMLCLRRRRSCSVINPGEEAGLIGTNDLIHKPVKLLLDWWLFTVFIRLIVREMFRIMLRSLITVTRIWFNKDFVIVLINWLVIDYWLSLFQVTYHFQSDRAAPHVCRQSRHQLSRCTCCRCRNGSTSRCTDLCSVGGAKQGVHRNFPGEFIEFKHSYSVFFILSALKRFIKIMGYWNGIFSPSAGLCGWTSPSVTRRVSCDQRPSWLRPAGSVHLPSARWLAANWGGAFPGVACRGRNRHHPNIP